MSKRLTVKQKSFVAHYLANGLNATQAAADAGYKGSRSTLATVGYENLRKPDISAEINKKLGDMAMSPEKVKALLSQFAEPVNVADYYSIETVDTSNGTKNVLVPDLERIRRDGLGTRIKRMYPTSAGIVIEWHDPANALDKLNKVYGAYTENIKAEHQHTVLVLDEKAVEGK